MAFKAVIIMSATFQQLFLCKFITPGHSPLVTSARCYNLLSNNVYFIIQLAGQSRRCGPVQFIKLITNCQRFRYD